MNTFLLLLHLLLGVAPVAHTVAAPAVHQVVTLALQASPQVFKVSMPI